MIVIGIFIAAEPQALRPRHRLDAAAAPPRRLLPIADHVGFTLRRLLFGRLVGMVFEGVFTFYADGRRGADGRAARPGHRPARLHPQYRRDRFGHADGRGRLFAPGPTPASGRSSSISSSRISMAIWSCPISPGGRSTWRRRWCLAMQLLMGALFGMLGLLFADPILATLKVILVDPQRRAARPSADGKAGRRLAPAAPAAAPLGCCCCCWSCCICRSSPRRRGPPCGLRHRRSGRCRRGKPGGGGPAPQARLGGMVKRYSPPSRIRPIASAKPGKTCAGGESAAGRRAIR